MAHPPRTHASALLLILLFIPSTHAAELIPLQPPPPGLPAKADLVPWPLGAYPAFTGSSAGHVGAWLFDRPAGRHGVVRARADGSLCFEDGTPARFWGTTTVYAMSFPDKPAQIAAMAENIAARGYNLVRFHHNDICRVGLGYLQQKPKSNYKLDAVGMNRLDRLAAELIKRGIYIYLDLIDYRQLLEEDGIFKIFPGMRKMVSKNHGWKGLFPHPVIIQAWKRAVTSLLRHRNPYTGHTWAEEPAIVSIEIINENGPFWDWSFQVSDDVQQWYDRAWNPYCQW